MSWRIVKRLGENWDITRDGAGVLLESLTYRIWLEGENVLSSVSWLVPRQSAAGRAEVENPADAHVDIQTTAHRLVGRGGETRLFGRSPETREPYPIGLVREVEVSAGMAVPHLFTMKVTYFGICNNRYPGARWPDELPPDEPLNQTFKRLNRYELLLKGSDDDGQGTAEPDRPA